MLSLPWLPTQAAEPVAVRPAAVCRLTLAEARDRALAQNSALELARLNGGEKALATSAAFRDYFPKFLATGYYFHFSDDLGTVLASRGRELGGATIGPRGRLQLPTFNIPSKSV